MPAGPAAWIAKGLPLVGRLWDMSLGLHEMHHRRAGVKHFTSAEHTDSI